MSKPQPVRLPSRIYGLSAPGTKIRMPSPNMIRAPSPIVPRAASRAAPACRACGSTSFTEDSGQTVCEGCGAITADNGNFANDVTFQETDSGRTLQSGTKVGHHQTHQSTFRTGTSAFNLAGRESMPTGDKALSEARQLFVNYSHVLHIREQERATAAQIFQMAYLNRFVRGRTIENVAVVCLYLATRRAKDKVPPYSLMLIDFAEIADINVFDLGKMMQDMVKRLYIKMDGVSERDHILLRAPGAEVLIERFVKHLDFGDDENKIKRDATKILQRMKKDWLHDGRRPAGVCGAAVILAARMNNYRRTLREVVLCAKVTEITIKQRLDEFGVTDSSKLSVNEFRDDQVRNDVREMDPPAFYRAKLPPKKKRGRPRKNAQPETAAEIENGDEATEDRTEDQSVDGDEPPQKRARIDADGFAVPELPTRAGQTANIDQPVRRGPGKPKGSKNWKAPPPTQEEIDYEREVEQDIQQALDSNQDLDETAVREEENTAPACEVTPADVAVYQHDVLPRDDPPGPRVWNNDGNKGNVNMNEDIGDTEFDDDLEVSTCILSEAERALKETIWVTENAEWLRQDHAKRIRRELRDRDLREQGIDPDELRKQKGKILKRKDGARRSGRVGDVDYLQDDFHKRKTSIGVQGANGDDNGQAGNDEGEGENAMASVRKMFNQRGTFSRRINYESLLNAYSYPSDESSRSPTGSPDRNTRAGSVVSTASSTASGASTRRRTNLADLFHGTKNSTTTRSRASIAQEKRQAREKAEREKEKERHGSKSSETPNESASGASERDGQHINVDEEADDDDHIDRQRTGSAVSPPPAILPTPPQTQTQVQPQPGQIPQIRTTNTHKSDHQPSNEEPDEQDSPLSSTHTPQGFGSGAHTPTFPPPAQPSPSSISASAHTKLHSPAQTQLEARIQARIQQQDEDEEDDDDDEGDSDDYVDEDEEDDVDIEAAFEGKYAGHQWDDEIVEDG